MNNSLIDFDFQTREKRLRKRGKYIEEIMAGITFMFCIVVMVLLAMVLIK